MIDRCQDALDSHMKAGIERVPGCRIDEPDVRASRNVPFAKHDAPEIVLADLTDRPSCVTQGRPAACSRGGRLGAPTSKPALRGCPGPLSAGVPPEAAEGLSWGLSTRMRGVFIRSLA